MDDRPGLSALSVQGAHALRPCLARLTCLAFDDRATWEEETAACWDDATLRVEPIPESRGFCAEYARGSFECHAYAGTAECERAFSMLSPAVIERLEPCLGAACEMDVCIEEVIATL